MSLPAFAVVLTLLVPVFAPAPGPCPEVAVIGVAGSGQHGFGEQVEPVVEGIIGVLAADGMAGESEALDYPAVSVSDSFGLVLLTGEYQSSVHTGADRLLARIEDVSATCPREEIVLVGYSQGAQVIKTALEHAGPGLRITAIVLLADPTRDPDQAGIVRLGDATTEREGALGAIALPDHLRAVAIDLCAPGDGVCERGRRGLSAHIDGYANAVETVLPSILAEFADRPGNLNPLR